MARVQRPEKYGSGDDVAAVGETGQGALRRAGPADLSAAVEAARTGDEAAFRTLFRAVQPGLLRYLWTLVGDDAEDVASETWLQVARDLAAFHGDSDGFRGWVATVGRHRALDHLRRLRRAPRTGAPVEYLAELPAGDDPAGSALSSVATEAALALIRTLPRDQAEAVLLRVVMDLDAAGAARVLGKRPGAVRMAAHRGLRRLADLLDRSGTPPPEGDSGPGVTRMSPSTLKETR
ncbi:RNA polymerase sigma factor [Peterkaempfera sp. SMS 1(5)a]|uniref:RNA polymerase sigma factor n=1 Tax=Peterkaempfera podocarpi TaxID=3232308 RepID=UPI00366C9B26